MSNEQRTQHYISIMQAYVAGEAIEVKEKANFGSWSSAGNPQWNWNEREYRVKRKSKPSVDWSALHPDIKFIARDSNGAIFGYHEKPTVKPHGSAIWYATGALVAVKLNSVVASLKPGDCDWKDSLVKRP